MNEHARHASQNSQEERRATRAAGRARGGKYLGFSLEKQLFGVEILRVREIVCGPVITPVPRAGHAVRGVINLRGKIIPVVDLRLSFGMAPVVQDDRTCFIVVDVVREGAETQIGVLVDAVSEVLNIPDADIEPPPDLAAGDDQSVLGIAKVKGSVRMLLDIDAAIQG
jgi:purine-binding chemotaxis protein CheW